MNRHLCIHMCIYIFIYIYKSEIKRPQQQNKHIPDRKECLNEFI